MFTGVPLDKGCCVRVVGLLHTYTSTHTHIQKVNQSLIDPFIHRPFV